MNDPMRTPPVAVITCEHASNALPPEAGTLGLDPGTFDTHVAWDPGAPEVALALARALPAPIFLGRYSRLYVDLNRSPSNPQVVPSVAFGVPVPGNAALDAAARAARLTAVHAPYWEQVFGFVARAVESRRRVLHLSVHSFTEQLGAERRALDFGVLFDPERAFEAAVSAVFRRALTAEGLDVRDNQPYDGRHDGLTTALRARFVDACYAGVTLEISHRWLPRIAALAGHVVGAAARALAQA